MNKFRAKYKKVQEQARTSEYAAKFLSRTATDGEMVVHSQAMRRILDICDTVADTDSSVLISGESGTGKEVVANYIHHNSNRRDQLFIPVNCSAIPPELMEAEFFGYKKGAFTGANPNGSVGLFEAANHGTLFPDEIWKTLIINSSNKSRFLFADKIKNLFCCFYKAAPPFKFLYKPSFVLINSYRIMLF